MKRLLTAATALALLASVAGGTASAAAAAPTPRHFSFTAGQTPENVALAPHGALDVTFSVARQVAEIDSHGIAHVLWGFRQPADHGRKTPGLGFAATMGLVRDHDGTVYFLYAAGSSMTGVWRLRGHGEPTQIAGLPADSLPNGLALDPRTGLLYIADSALGRVWSVPRSGGKPVVWSKRKELTKVHRFGANGIKVHDGAVWATNTDRGTLLRIPLLPNGKAGTPVVRAHGLTSVDDFTFTGRGDEVLAALNVVDSVVRIEPDGNWTTVLAGRRDGLENPTSIAVRGDKAYVLSAAYVTHTDPNLLVARLPGLR